MNEPFNHHHQSNILLLFLLITLGLEILLKLKRHKFIQHKHVNSIQSNTNAQSPFEMNAIYIKMTIVMYERVVVVAVLRIWSLV